MQIRPTNNIQTTQSVNLQPRNSTEQTANAAPVDSLDISAEAQMLSNNQTTDGIRSDRVAELRAQIADGNYDTAEKLDVALSRMLNEIA